MNTEDIHIGIGMVMYIGYTIALNWMYIKEWGQQSKGNVIRRGKEWE